MATTVTELRLRRGGTRTKGRKRSYTRQFRVTTDVATLDTIDVRTLTGIPQINEPHPRDPSAFCYHINVSQPFEDKQIWELSCDYQNIGIDVQSTGESNLTSARPKVRWTSAKFREPYEAAWIVGGTGVAPATVGQFRVLSNSRGQPFTPPQEKDQTRKIVTITRGEATYNPDTAGTYEDAINSAAIMIAGKQFAKHCGKIESITAETTFENGTLFWIVTYEIHHKRDTWNVTLYDKATDADGGTVFLNGQGVELEPAELAAGVVPATTIARPYEEKDFAALSLPTAV